MTLQQQSSQGIFFGALFQALGWFMRTHAGTRSVMIGGVIGMVLGLVIFTRGCVALAESRGQAKLTGLLGLLSVIGLAVLWFLPAKGVQSK